MSKYGALLKKLWESGLDPTVESSDSGGHIMTDKNSEKYVFNPKGQLIDFNDYQANKALYELRWMFPSIDEKKEHILRECSKIYLLAEPYDYYKIQFFVDKNKYMTFELKDYTDRYVFRNQAKSRIKYLSENGYLPVTSQQALSMIESCPYKHDTRLVIKPEPMVFKYVRYLLGCDLNSGTDQELIFEYKQSFPRQLVSV